MPDLELQLKPSKCYVALMSALLLLTVGVILSLTFNNLGKLFLLLGVSIDGCRLIWRYGFLRGPDAILSVRAIADGIWQVRTQQETYLATLANDSTLTTIASVCRWRLPTKKSFICVIFPDSCAPHLYRRFRRYIKLYQTFPSRTTG